MVKAEDRVEFVGAIMDVIEDVLEENGISFPNNKQLMREAGCSEEEIEENDVVLYGENYDMFADSIAKVLEEWNVFEKKCGDCGAYCDGGVCYKYGERVDYDDNGKDCWHKL